MAQAQAVEAVLEARGQVRQAAQGLGPQEGGLAPLGHLLQAVFSMGGQGGGGGAQGQAPVALPAVPLREFPADELGGVGQGSEELLGALQLDEGLTQSAQLPLGRPVLEQVPQAALGLPPDLGGGIQHPQPRHPAQGLVHGQARSQPCGPAQAVHEPEAGRAGVFRIQKGQGPRLQAPVPAAGQLERQLGNPHRQHRNLQKGSKYGEFLAKCNRWAR